MNRNRNRFGRYLMPLLLAMMLLTGALPTGAAPAKDGTDMNGHHVRQVYLDFWKSHGGLAQIGNPISDEQIEVSPTNGKAYQVQHFERLLLEWHPEYAGTPNEIEGSLLGVFAYQNRYPQGAPGQVPNNSAGSVNFPQTNHRLGGRFLAYWQSHGGLAQQGYPISDEFTEVSQLNNKPYTVQYFQRAVFEYHPEFGGTVNEVELSQLGTYQYVSYTTWAALDKLLKGAMSQPVPDQSTQDGWNAQQARINNLVGQINNIPQLMFNPAVHRWNKGDGNSRNFKLELVVTQQHTHPKLCDASMNGGYNFWMWLPGLSMSDHPGGQNLDYGFAIAAGNQPVDDGGLAIELAPGLWDKLVSYMVGNPGTNDYNAQRSYVDGAVGLFNAYTQNAFRRIEYNPKSPEYNNNHNYGVSVIATESNSYPQTCQAGWGGHPYSALLWLSPALAMGDGGPGSTIMGYGLAIAVGPLELNEPGRAWTLANNLQN